MKLSVELDSHILWETRYSLGPFKNERGEIDSLLWVHDAGGPPEVLPGRTNDRITVHFSNDSSGVGRHYEQ
jgi:hypothetical protein